MYVALQAVGQQPELDELIDERYISSPFGSTLVDLEKLAHDYHVSATSVQGMTVGMLRDAPGPVVLHARRPRRASPYQHWIVYLGVEGGMAKVVDPPSGLDLVPFSEILAHWDGVGLMLSEAPVPHSRLMRAGWFEHGFHVVVAICAILGLAVLVGGRRREYVNGKIAGLGIICAVTLALALAHHGLTSDGLLANPSAVASVVTRHHASTVPELSLAAFEASRSENPLVIDVRLPSAYKAGCIPGAVSLPISSTTSERLRFWSSVPEDRQVILYCQSDQCGWSDELASEMVMRGYRHVSVYRGGYQEWQDVALAGK
jgi:rhodanese-related sulfurtransferase